MKGRDNLEGLDVSDIKMNVGSVWCEYHWIRLTQYKLPKSRYCEHVSEPSISVKCEEFSE